MIPPPAVPSGLGDPKSLSRLNSDSYCRPCRPGAPRVYDISFVSLRVPPRVSISAVHLPISASNGRSSHRHNSHRGVQLWSDSDQRGRQSSVEVHAACVQVRDTWSPRCWKAQCVSSRSLIEIPILSCLHPMFPSGISSLLSQH